MKRHFPDIKKIISIKNLAVKIICVLLSVILWKYINNINISEIKFKIPITFINLPEALVSSDISDKYVTITLSGRKDNIKNINAKSIKAIVNLGNPDIDINQKYPVEINSEEIPENVDMNLSIKEVSLKVEKKIIKKVFIKAKIVNKIKNGFVLGRIKIFPESVNISGPESSVRNIDFLQTEKITVNNSRIKIIEKEILIDNQNPDIDTDVKKVKVIIPVIESSGLAEFKKKIIIRYNNDKYTYTLSQQEVSVYLRSERADVQPAEGDTDVFIDIDSTGLDEFLIEGSNHYIEKIFPVNAVVKKEGIKAVSISPDIVSVKISGK
jgi:YbbR domain-containing protein